MVISISKTFAHNNSFGKQGLEQENLEKTVMEQLSKQGISSNDVRWNEQGHLELQNPDDLKLHTLMLQMESLGLDLKMTKQMLIEVC